MTILRRRRYRPPKGTPCAVGSLCGLASYLLQIPMGGEGRTRYGLGLRPAPTPADRSRSQSRSCANSGIAVLRSGEASVVFCAMPNGLRGKGSHTHCDKLSVVFRLGAEEVFCDSGSRCYTRSAELRNLDRSTRAHNTLMVDGADQNTFRTDPGLLFQMRQRSGCFADCVIGKRRDGGAGIASGLFQDWHRAPEDGATEPRAHCRCSMR